MRRGAVRRIVHRSALLRGNPLGDPWRREVFVYTPPGWRPGRSFPGLLALAGFAGSGFGFLNRRWRQESLPERLDRLVAAGMPPVVVAMPDVLTAVGGGQYVDSPGTGRYASWLALELLPELERRFPTGGRWGVFGSSSGGYGALRLAMDFPGVFSAIAAHSPDAGFEVCYPPDLPGAAEAIREAGGVAAWWNGFRSRRGLRGGDHAVLNMLAMSCAWSPAPGRRPLPCELPVELETGALAPEVFARWLEHDPVRLAPLRAGALGGLRLLWLDAGRHDEFRLQVGARLLHRALDSAGVGHCFEEHEGGHFGLSERLDRSLPRVAEALAGG